MVNSSQHAPNETLHPQCPCLWVWAASNWCGHILLPGEAGPARCTPPTPPHSPTPESFVITSWLHCAIGQAPPRWEVKPLKGNYFIDTIRDDILFDVLPPQSAPHPNPALHPNCSLGSAGSMCVCVGVWELEKEGVCVLNVFVSLPLQIPHLPHRTFLSRKIPDKSPTDM